MPSLKKLRETKTGLTQGQMAVRLGVSPSSVCQYEKGNRRPSLSTMQRMASILGVDMQLLMNVFLAKERKAQ